MAAYTSGVMKVMPGHEDDFVNAWKDFATRTKAEHPNVVATLLRDRDDPRLFMSVTRWESVEEIEQWRTSETWQTGMGKIRPLLAELTPRMLDVAARIG